MLVSQCSSVRQRQREARMAGFLGASRRTTAVRCRSSVAVVVVVMVLYVVRYGL